MKRLDLDRLDQRTAAVEAVVDQTPGIDPWCSGPDWVLAVHAGFGPGSGAEPIVLAADHGFALLARYPLDEGPPIVAGLEPLWGFAAPVIGPDLTATAAAMADHLADDGGWSRLVLPGLPPPGPDQPATLLVARGVARLGSVGAMTGITRQVAEIGSGLDPWLARRSPRFRRSLRRIERAAAAAGVTVIDGADDPDPFGRILDVEEGSWKGAEGSGLSSVEMATTYRVLVGRLRRTGRLRLLFARRDGRDVGYILGGVRARRYRGLQLSYRHEVASLSIGHLLQLHEIRRLCDEGAADLYDLGMDLDYKRRWADHAVASVTLVIDRDRRPDPSDDPVAAAPAPSEALG